MISVERSYIPGGMTPAKTDSNTTIAQEVLQAFDDINPTQPGFRPAHAKGILLAGGFTPSPGAASLTRAPHLKRSPTRVTVRFSDATGLPTIADGDPNASPRGMAIRFHLADHVHTDIAAKWLKAESDRAERVLRGPADRPPHCR